MRDGPLTCDVCDQRTVGLSQLVIPYRGSSFVRLFGLPRFDGLVCADCRRSIEEASTNAALKAIDDIRKMSSSSGGSRKKISVRLRGLVERLVSDDFVTK